MLNKVVDPSAIHGLVVCHAHRVSDTSTEAFIVRLYRTANRDGFLKVRPYPPPPQSNPKYRNYYYTQFALAPLHPQPSRLELG